MDRVPATLLPDSHWWTHDGRTLYHNFRWMASVGDGLVTVRTRAGQVQGPCGSDAQGRRHAERWLSAQSEPKRPPLR